MAVSTQARSQVPQFNDSLEIPSDERVGASATCEPASVPAPLVLVSGAENSAGPGDNTVAGAVFEPEEPGDAVRVCRVDMAEETFAVISMPAYDPSIAELLTASERDIAMRILLGLSNQEIADARGSRLSTVSNQIYSIFDKLGVESRAQLAERMVASGARAVD